MATAIGSRYHVGNTSSRKNTEVKQGLDVDPGTYKYRKIPEAEKREKKEN